MHNKISKQVDISKSSKVSGSKLSYYVRVKDYVEIRNSRIGKYTSISQFSIINKAKIGKFCSIGHGAYIGLWEHDTDVSTHPFYLYPHNGAFVKEYKDYKKDLIKTKIGNDVWIGAGAIVLKGINIGDGAIVGAGSIVTKDVMPYTVVVGNPAKYLKNRFNQKDINWLLKSKWWNLSRKDLKKIINKNAFESISKLKILTKKVKRFD